MFYAVRHFTRYRYSRPVWQSIMEVRMHPRSEHMQRCFTFQLSVSPRARIFSRYAALLEHITLSEHFMLVDYIPARRARRRPPEFTA